MYPVVQTEFQKKGDLSCQVNEVEKFKVKSELNSILCSQAPLDICRRDMVSNSSFITA